ncbi:RsmE family RNA methyltransferase [Planctomicrobium piriforme]|uniref:Ribosomal RNA small subunit methyltransferase E n=1 Tax=Planctomicrobium piriforme TaxID=1576369 RepID=A0A1I3RHY5_9PLAN|nr:RsmE family RNA methyltransferase [Planctomicrobium piriforme]SFJ45895.1 16S rRNA (uracil1498-N3)-methyltransferase [Planctomicrobium piriforme]
MADRFYVPTPWTEVIQIEGPEAHHLAHVLRAQPGEEVELFDGRGTSVLAEVVEVRKRNVSVRCTGEPRRTSNETPELILAVACPKGDRLRWMIEKITELGIDRLIPLKTTRSVVEPSEHKFHKLEQTVVAACKQCRRDTLLQIDDLCPLETLRSHFPEGATQLLWGEADADDAIADKSPSSGPPRQIVAVIGPEGGLTPDERNLLHCWEAKAISFSPFVLRIETAAVACASRLVGQRRRKEF